jgi:hypothetical protein
MARSDADLVLCPDEMRGAERGQYCVFLVRESAGVEAEAQQSRGGFAVRPIGPGSRNFGVGGSTTFHRRS